MVAPLVLFVVVTVIVPVALFLFRAVDNRDLQTDLGRHLSRAVGLDGRATACRPSRPSPRWSQDLAAAQAAGRAGTLAARLNQAVPGSAHASSSRPPRLAAEGALTGPDVRGAACWRRQRAGKNPALWSVIAQERGRFTAYLPADQPRPAAPS